MENQSTDTGRMCRMKLKEFLRLVHFPPIPGRFPNDPLPQRVATLVEEVGLDADADIILIEPSYDLRRTKSVN